MRGTSHVMKDVAVAVKIFQTHVLARCSCLRLFLGAQKFLISQSSVKSLRVHGCVRFVREGISAAEDAAVYRFCSRLLSVYHHGRHSANWCKGSSRDTRYDFQLRS